MVPVVQRHDRSTVDLYDDHVVKRFTNRDAMNRELSIYQFIPWACPRLLDFDDMSIMIERRPLAVDHPEWRPVNAMRALIDRLFSMNIHHRDIHAKNIVMGHDGEPLLIDWETAITQQADESYDLVGPSSGVPKPIEHDGYQAQWWGSGATRFALDRWWG